MRLGAALLRWALECVQILTDGCLNSVCGTGVVVACPVALADNPGALHSCGSLDPFLPQGVPPRLFISYVILPLLQSKERERKKSFASLLSNLRMENGNFRASVDSL